MNLIIEIKNFWRNLSKLDKIFLIMYLMALCITIILIIFWSIGNENAEKMIGLFVSIFSFGKIYETLKEYNKNVDSLKERDFNLDIMWGIYELRKKLIYDLSEKTDECNEFGKIMVTVPDSDASFLLSGVLSIKESINVLLKNPTLSFQEKRTLNIIQARINDFIERNPNIPKMEDGIFFVKPMLIDKKWIVDIKYLFEEKYSVGAKKRKLNIFKPCDISLEKMKNKFDFGYII